MFDFWMAVLLGACAGGWVYFKLNRGSADARSGSQVIAGAAVGLLVFFILYTLLKYVLHID